MPIEDGVSGLNPPRWNDPSYLRNVQYADDSNFAARQAIYAFQQPRIRMYDWALDLARLRGDETIVDVGCGNGAYLRALARRGHRGLVLGMDFSAGMLRSAREGLAAEAAPAQQLAQGDAAALPIREDSARVALAMHMLYHVPDRAGALAELRRVTARGGVVLVVLNGKGHNAELRALVREGIRGTGGRRESEPVSLDLDAGEELASQYFEVERHDVGARLVVTDVAPVVDYVRSMRFMASIAGGEEELLGYVGARVAAVIAEEGAFRITTASGCLVCR